MQYLRQLTKLQSLTLWGTQVTDAGLVNVKGLTQLQSLNLSKTQVTDAGLVNLKGLMKLQDWTWRNPRSLTQDWYT